MNANRCAPSFSAGRVHANAEALVAGGSDGNGWGKRSRSGGNEPRD